MAEWEARPTGIGELDRVLSGGLVPGSVTLLGGEPGVGKSTLLTQVAAAMAHAGGRVLYVSAEESSQQVRLRAERLDALAPRLWLAAETNLPHIVSHFDAVRPDVVIVDSIQTVHDPELGSAPGSVVQVRECAHRLVREAKERGVAVVLVGHVTKDGGLAGPRARARGRHRVGLRRRAPPRVAPRARGEAPLRLDQRGGALRDGRRRAHPRPRCQRPVSRGPPTGRAGLDRGAGARWAPAAARRGAGAHHRDERADGSTVGARPRRRAARVPAGGARAPRQVGDRQARRVRARGRRRASSSPAPISRSRSPWRRRSPTWRCPTTSSPAPSSGSAVSCARSARRRAGWRRRRVSGFDACSCHIPRPSHHSVSPRCAPQRSARRSRWQVSTRRLRR